MSQNAEAFGKYILLEKVAMGGMAEVYLAKNQGAGGIAKFVAIKRILPQYSENANFIDMFKTEARIAVNLAHSNIVSIHEFGVEKEQFFIVMDFVEGRNLRQILNKMKKGNVAFSIEQVLYIVKEIAGGLDHAHRCLDGSTGKPLNIIHRDMSPQNVMVNFEGEVKIVDFGIAKAETQIETTRAGELKGKFGYMSPEQAEGQVVDLRTDIFSLGIVLWELLANDRLFIANNEVNTLRKIRECQIPSLRKINPNIQPELERIVSKALAKDRNLRYQTSAALHRELSRFLNRQFPDFSSHDFSIFIKTLFAGEILESRKKQIEYARVEVQQPKPVLQALPDKTVFTKTGLSVTEATTPDTTDPNAPPDFSNDRHVKKAGGPSAERAAITPNRAGGNSAAGNSATANVAQGKTGTKPRKPGIDPELSSTELRVQRSPAFRDMPREGSFHREQTHTNSRDSFTHSGTHGQTYYGTRSISRKPRGFFDRVPPSTITAAFLTCLIVGVFGTYIHDPQKTTAFASGQLVKLGLLKLPNIRSGTNESNFPSSAPVEFVTVPISTNPAGATVIIDGVPYPDVTPVSAEIPVPKDGHKPVVELRVRGFLKYSEVIDLTKSPSINRVLTSDQRGYINITVIGNGQITVNGKLTALSSPANNIEVPANQDVTVRAFDPATNAVDSRTIRVGENKVQSVTLIPRSPSVRRVPAQNK